MAGMIVCKNGGNDKWDIVRIQGPAHLVIMTSQLGIQPPAPVKLGEYFARIYHAQPSHRHTNQSIYIGEKSITMDDIQGDRLDEQKKCGAADHNQLPRNTDEKESVPAKAKVEELKTKKSNDITKKTKATSAEVKKSEGAPKKRRGVVKKKSKTKAETVIWYQNQLTKEDAKAVAVTIKSGEGAAEVKGGVVVPKELVKKLVKEVVKEVAATIKLGEGAAEVKGGVELAKELVKEVVDVVMEEGEEVATVATVAPKNIKKVVRDGTDKEVAVNKEMTLDAKCAATRKICTEGKSHMMSERKSDMEND